MSKRFRIAADMLNLIDIINKIETDSHEANQYIHYAKQVIYLLATRTKTKDVLQNIKLWTSPASKIHDGFIANDGAREFFEMYLKSLEDKKPLKIAYHEHNARMGDKHLPELQEKFKALKNNFFI